QDYPAFLGINFIGTTATSTFSHVLLKNIPTNNTIMQIFNASYVTGDFMQIENSGNGIIAFNSGKADLSNFSEKNISGVGLEVYNQSSITCDTCVFDTVGTQDGILVFNSGNLSLSHSKLTHSGSEAALSAYGNENSAPTTV